MGNLYIVSTPIGNLEDITLRALKVLFSVKYIACEDTRRTGQLINSYESRIKSQELRIKDLEISTKAQLISYYDEIESTKASEIIELLKENYDVALASDCGTPLISDPGYKLVRLCQDNGIKVIPIPGPSSILAALVSSGLPANKFTYLGYLSENKNKRLKEIADFLKLKSTIIIFESPHRFIKTLNELKNILGDIEIVIARELTKFHEETYRAKISECLRYFSIPKGEFVLLLNIEKSCLPK